MFPCFVKAALVSTVIIVAHTLCGFFSVSSAQPAKPLLTQPIEKQAQTLPPLGIDPSQPEVFIKTLMTQGIGLLGNKQKSTPEKETVFRNILRTCFDLKSISGFALGAHKRGQPESVLNEYLHLFEAMVFRVYMDQLEQLTLKGFQILSIMDTEDGGKRVIVEVQRTEANQPTKVEWILFPKDQRYWVFDVILNLDDSNNVRMSALQAQRMSTMLTENGSTLEGLLAALRKEYGHDVLP